MSNDYSAEVINALLDDRDLLGMQLGLALTPSEGGEDYVAGEVAKVQNQKPEYTPEELQKRVTWLVRTIGVRADMDVVTTIFACSFDEAMDAIQNAWAGLEKSYG